MAKPDQAQLEAYLQSQKNSLSFILSLLASLDRLPYQAYLTPKRAKITILPKQKISLEKAWQLVVDYLESHDLPYYLRQQTHNLKLTPNNVFVVYHFLQRAHLELESLQTPEQLDQLIKTFKQANQLPPTEEVSAYQKAILAWKNSVNQYNQHLAEIAQIIDPTTTIPVGGAQFLHQPTTATTIASFVPEIISLAKKSDSQGNLTPENIHLAVNRLAKQHPHHPELRYLSTLLFNPTNQRTFFEKIEHLETTPSSPLHQLRQTQENIALNPPPPLPLSEIERQIYLILTTKTNLSSREATNLSRKLVGQIQASAFDLRRPPVAVDQLAKDILKKEGVSHPEVVTQLLAPTFPHLDRHRFEQRQDFVLAHQHHALLPFSSFILATLAKETGLDPVTLATDPFSEARNKLGLSPNTSPEEILDLIKQKINSSQDPREIADYLDLDDRLQRRFALEQKLESKLLKWSAKLLIKAYDNNLIISKAFNRYAIAYKRGVDLYLKAEDFLTGQWLFDKIYQKIENLKKTRWGWFIAPFEKAGLAWHNFVVGRVNQWIESLSSKSGGLATATKKILELFRLGNYSLDGFVWESVKAISVAAYKKATDLFSKASSPIIKGVGTAIGWIGQKLILGLNSEFVQSISAFLGPAVGLAIQLGLLVWNFFGDTFSFFKDVFASLKSASFTQTLLGIFQAVRRWGIKNISGLTGAIIGAILFSPTLVGAVIAAITGFLFGHSIGKLLNDFYEKFLKPYALFLLSAFLAFITSMGAIVIGSALVFLGGPLLIAAIIIYFAFSANMASRIPDANIDVTFFPNQLINCTSEVLPAPGPKPTAPIALKAWQIVNNLQQGFWCYWNRSPDYPKLFDMAYYQRNPNPLEEEVNNRGDVLFWCTWLVVKSYVESGHSIVNTLGSSPMWAGWPAGKKIIASQVTSSNAIPGSVIFFHVTGRHEGANHVAIITGADDTGIYYVQSNGPVKGGFIPFQESGVGLVDPSWGIIIGIGQP